jgi:pimeloyl-ACP methyl ester carboxylesterase
VAIGYAVAHPERVSHLVLAGGYARGRLVSAQTEEQRRAALLDLELARVGMAGDDPSFLQVFAAQLLPDATRQDWLAFVDYLRHTTSAVNVVRFLQVFAQIDVVDLARQVRVPTLILHARDDVRVPSSCAVELAGLIPGSRLVLLEGRNHLLGVDDPSWADLLRQVTDFVGSGVRHGDPPDPDGRSRDRAGDGPPDPAPGWPAPG